MTRILLTLELAILLFSHSLGAETPVVRLVERVRAAISAELPKNAHVHLEHWYCRQPAPPSADIVVVSPHPPVGVTQVHFTWWEGEKSREAYGTATVRVVLPMAVVRSPIAHGDVFSSANVAFEKRELSVFAHTGYFTDWHSLEGLSATGSLHPGQVIGTLNVHRDPVISNGQYVQLVRERGNLKIQARVKALQAGRVDSMIRVENPSSHRIIIARVTAPGEVTIP